MTATTPGRKLAPGDRVTPHRLASITGGVVEVPAPDKLVHLQFRRYAGCPYCNLHLRSIVARHDEIRAAGIREVVVFHSTAEELRAHNESVPFAVVADPDKHLYREFGVESSARALLDPRSWAPALRGVAAKRRPLAGDHRSGHLGLPADFLIAPDGHVLASKYGSHAFDQWSVDELLGQPFPHAVH
jgi:peroxiredoxin